MKRTAPLALLVLLLAAGAGGAWLFLRPGAFEAAYAQPAESQAPSLALPLPPEPTRLEGGPDYDRCLALLRDDPDEALRFAAAFDATGGGESARHCHALALIATGEPARGAERLERLGAGSRAGNAARANLFGQAAQAWLMVGEPNRAYGAVTIALTLSPSDTELLTDRSVVLAQMRRYLESLQDLDRVLQLEPARAEAWVLRAAALRHLDRALPAMEAAERALALTPENPEALLERGILRQLRGEFAAAQADWRRAMEVAPGSAAAELAEQNLRLSEFGAARR